MTLQEIMNYAHATATEKGWWDDNPPRTFGDQIALMHSELSEALEQYRVTGMLSTGFLYLAGGRSTDKQKPEGIAIEFADVLIRIFDTCEHYQIPLDKALEIKLAYNKTRQKKHGGKII